LVMNKWSVNMGRKSWNLIRMDRHGRDHMIVGFTTTCAISAYNR
jgi:hypothetical protein